MMCWQGSSRENLRAVLVEGLGSLRMSRLAALIWYVLFFSGCLWVQPAVEKEASRSGREQVLQALKAPEGTGKLLGRSGVISTAFSSSTFDPRKPLKVLDPDDAHGGRAFNMELLDGTRVGGLFFEYHDGTDEPQPLLMASFGFLQDRWGTEAAKFHELYLKDRTERIPAHVLILDHPTAGPFLANNGHLSVGSYDDARMWIEIAQRLRTELNLAGIHLFGVSMSGQTVVHALIEDRRLGLDLFESGMVCSIAPDFHQAPGKQLAQLATPEGIENPWKLYFKATPSKSLTDAIQSEALWMLITKQFIPHYGKVYPAGQELEIQLEDVAVFFRKAFEDRITFLREREVGTWNRDEFSCANLDSFMTSTRIARVIHRIRSPLVMVSAYDDPAVERTMFQELMLAARGNPWIAAYETNDGGHFGFDVAYGKDYIGRIIRLMLDPQVLRTWNGKAEEH
jgi:hypothetical protein